MANLRIIPLDEVVAFPGMPVTLPVDVGKDTHVLLLPRQEDEYAVRGPDAVTLSVQDTGIGIAPENQEMIFEEFRQVGNAWTQKQEGTGLGLALARRLVALHGGRLWVESALGTGSTFRFTIPLTEQAARAVAAGGG